MENTTDPLFLEKPLAIIIPKANLRTENQSESGISIKMEK